MYFFICAESFVFGNDPSGTGTFKKLHNGPHPSFTLKTNSLSFGTVLLTSSTQLLKYATDASFPSSMASKRPKICKE